MALPTDIVGDDTGHISHHNLIHTMLNGDEREIFVSTKAWASDSNTGLTPGAPLASIEAARDLLADAPGTIYLGSGDHDATPDGDLIFTSEGQGIIAPGGPGQTRILMSGNGTWGVRGSHSFCTIEGFQLVTTGEVQYGVGISTPGSTGTASSGEMRRVWVIPGDSMEGAFCLGPDHAGSSTVDLAGTTLEHCTYFPNTGGAPAFGILEYGYLIGNGTSGNVLQNSTYNCQGAGADYGVGLRGAGIQWFGGGFGYSQIADIHITQASGDVIAFYGGRSEVGAMALKSGYVGRGSTPVVLSGWAAIGYDPPDGETIINHNAGSLVIIGGGFSVVGGDCQVVVDEFSGGGLVFESHGVSYDSDDPYRGIPAAVTRITSGTMSDDAGLATSNPGADAAGGWNSYTPTLAGSGWSLGNGLLIGRWKAVNGVVNVDITITWGSTSTFGSAALTVSWPTAAPPASTIGLAAARVVALDQGIGLFNLNGYTGDPTKVELYAQGTNGEWGGPVNSTTPFTWASTDGIGISATYEAA